MKILFFNHFFDQDIDELVYNRQNTYEFKTINPSFFAKKVTKYLPQEVFKGLTEYLKPEYTELRDKFEMDLLNSFLELYVLYPFDLFISPSDTFFYIRPFIRICKDYGIPFFVVQKETTISPGTMEFHSLDLMKYYPFISDHMTVCSERHKLFWMKSGALDEQITVTGQPRFDFYLRKNKIEVLEDLNLNLSQGRKTILFFTYQVDAYLEITNQYGDWTELRNQTEDVLAALAQNQQYNILIKPHPQHQLEDIQNYTTRLLGLAGSTGAQSLFFLERNIDARRLIIASDLIIAFQTTALIEALALNKNVIYTFWSETALKAKSFIIPFHEYSEIIDCAKSPTDLFDSIQNQLKNPILKEEKKIKNFFYEILGPFDGKASERTWIKIEDYLRNNEESILSKKQMRDSLILKRNKILITEINLNKLRRFFANSFYFLSKLTLSSYIGELFRNQIQLLDLHISECEASLEGRLHSMQLIGKVDYIHSKINYKIYKLIYGIIKQNIFKRYNTITNGQENRTRQAN